MFENFDQKANQMFNIVSTVLKAMKGMSRSVTRNMLSCEGLNFGRKPEFKRFVFDNKRINICDNQCKSVAE